MSTATSPANRIRSNFVKTTRDEIVYREQKAGYSEVKVSSGTVLHVAEQTETKNRYQGRYVEIEECGARPVAVKTTHRNKPVRKDHNAGGRSHWMQGFFNRPSPPLWKCIAD